MIVVPGCLVAGWWQLSRAESGNELSWAYVFEWPIFAGYAVYMWWRLLHEAPEPLAGARGGGDTDLPEVGPVGTPDQTGTVGAARSDGQQAAHATRRADDGSRRAEDDAELEAYNRYLAQLSERGEAKRW